jgi:hypothetical protein
MSSEQPRRGRESTGSPLGSTAAIVITILAVVGGFLLLRQINDDDDPSDASDVTTNVGDTTGTGDTSVGDTSGVATTAVLTTLPLETTSTTVFTTEGAIVVVANASNVNGAAGQLTTALTGKGFDLVAATNANADIDVSKIFYDSANPLAQSVAQSIASLMLVAEVAPIESPAPVEGGALQGGATVLVLLGADKAGKTLDQMAAGGTGTATTVSGAESVTTVTATTTG